MTAIDDALQANRKAADSLGTDAAAEPARRLAVVTCMDARVDPAAALGLESGDAHVIRNAGGRVTSDVIRSLAASWHFLGTREVMVIHHTLCGMLTDDHEAPRRQLAEATGADISDLDLLTFSDEDGCVRQDVAAIRSSELAPDDLTVRGFIYGVETGLLREVSAT